MSLLEGDNQEKAMRIQVEMSVTRVTFPRGTKKAKVFGTVGGREVCIRLPKGHPVVQKAARTFWPELHSVGHGK